MAKNNFIFYADYMEDLQELDPVDFRTILLAMTCYQTEQELPEMNATLKCLFKVLCRRIDYDNEAYENTCSRNRENGSKGGRPKKNTIPENKENPTKPKETQENPEKPRETQDKPTETQANPKNPNMNRNMNWNKDMDIYNNPPNPPGGKVTASSMIEDKHFPSDLDQAVKEWVKYKSEKREGYKEIGLRNLLSEIENSVNRIGVDQVIYSIRHAMSSNWKGIHWEDAKKPQQYSNPFMNMLAEEPI